MEFYGFTRRNNSSVVVTIPSRLNVKENTQVKVQITVIESPSSIIEVSKDADAGS